MHFQTLHLWLFTSLFLNYEAVDISFHFVLISFGNTIQYNTTIFILNYNVFLQIIHTWLVLLFRESAALTSCYYGYNSTYSTVAWFVLKQNKKACHWVIFWVFLIKIFTNRQSLAANATSVRLTSTATRVQPVTQLVLKLCALVAIVCSGNYCVTTK